MEKITNVEMSSVFEWQNQAKQYPSTGKGIVYYKGLVSNNIYIDCLLYYDNDNKLAGILNHYPFGFAPYQRKGSVNIQVKHNKRRKGIATALLNEGMLKFQINLKKQDYTPLGKKFIENYNENN